MLRRIQNEQKLLNKGKSSAHYAIEYVSDFRWIARHSTGVNVYILLPSMYPFEPPRINVSKLTHPKVSLHHGTISLPDYRVIDSVLSILVYIETLIDEVYGPVEVKDGNCNHRRGKDTTNGSSHS